MKSLVLVIALLVLCAGLAQTKPGHALLADAGLYKPPASYTELTFAAPSDLPSTLPSPNSPINVSFSLHNVTGAARAYQWSVVLTKAGQKSQVKASGSTTVPAQDRVTVTKSVRAACTGGRLQVSVRLASPDESVDFWVTCPATAKRSK